MEIIEQVTLRGLQLPGHASVGGAENRSGLADRPANSIVRKMHTEQNVISPNMETVPSSLMFPSHPAIACVQNHAEVADNPPMFLVDKTEVVKKKTVQRHTLHTERLPVDRPVSFVCAFGQIVPSLSAVHGF